MRRYSSLIFTIVLLAMASLNTWAMDYKILDLGVLGDGSWSMANDINDAEQVVGCSQYYPGGDSHAFIWSLETGIIDLGALSGGGYSHANAINNNGIVVGESYAFSPINYDNGFTWNSESKMRSLIPLAGDGMSLARDINDSGMIAGSSRTGIWSYACCWDAAGNLTVVTGLNAQAQAINNTGDIVGTYDSEDGYIRAFWCDKNGDFEDIGTLGGDSSVAYAINNNGVVVGSSDTGYATSSAFMWVRGGNMTSIGTLGCLSSTAYDINDIGQIVGCGSDAYGRDLPFVWNESTGIIQLPSLPGAIGGVAYAINNKGEIVGISGEHAVLWTPVPEPSSILTLVFGIMGSGAFVWWRKR